MKQYICMDCSHEWLQELPEGEYPNCPECDSTDNIFRELAEMKVGAFTLYINGKPAYLGQEVETFRGEPGRLEGGRPPHKPISEGFVSIRLEGDTFECEYYAGVVKGKWVLEEVNRCFWCNKDITDEELLWDENAEPYCPYCKSHGILAHQEPSKGK